MSSLYGVNRRSVNSLPETGVMLKVGFSDALAPQLKFKESNPGFSAISAPTPTVVVQSKVAAMLEVTVKWGADVEPVPA